MRLCDTFTVAGFFAALIFFGYAFMDAISRPEVIVSYSTGECRRVDYMDGTHGDCSHLPEVYDVVWGE